MPVEQLTDANGRIKCDLEASPDDRQSVAALKARVAELEDQLAKVASLAHVHGAQRERVFAHNLLADLTKALAIY